MLVSKEPVANFAPTVFAVACVVRVQGNVLFLHRAPSRPSPLTWCLPGGKMEPEETPQNAMKRELFEETALLFSGKTLFPLYIRLPHIDYVLHLFEQDYQDLPSVALNEEHIDFTWTSLENAIASLPLIPTGKEALEMYYASTPT